MSDTILNSERVVEREKELGANDVVFPKPNELQIDIDSEADSEQLPYLISILQEIMVVSLAESKPSKTPRHRHVTLQLGKDVTPLERLCLQACLGSDRKRELLGYINLQQGDPSPTLFIKPKIIHACR